jgi:hypothetical protein
MKLSANVVFAPMEKITAMNARVFSVILSINLSPIKNQNFGLR